MVPQSSPLSTSNGRPQGHKWPFPVPNSCSEHQAIVQPEEMANGVPNFVALPIFPPHITAKTPIPGEQAMDKAAATKKPAATNKTSTIHNSRIKTSMFTRPLRIQHKEVLNIRMRTHKTIPKISHKPEITPMSQTTTTQLILTTVGSGMSQNEQ
ncbi:unnamed protein product [Cuscuta campestris]|uniref:Uncharacterized protein n=1 Tax=Cuscuta campestris TaxID=132261 RepID=A0A484KSG2_9ASTE|nr:unnamed protein product [Cuscuta campestris]